ncbi:MAG: molybdenum cofactor guanylyltransferase, partial [Dehalococcoidales bacterium]
SLRLGYDKFLETVGNKNLLQRVISCVSPLSGDIILVTARELTTLQSIDYPKLRVVTDIYPGKGPLIGIYTGLATSTLFYNLVVGSDMPFLNQALLRYMIQLSTNFDIVAPRVGNLVEPLHAVYSKSCLAPIERMIKEDKLRIYPLFNSVSVRYVEAEEIERFDPKHLSFFNINTKADLEKARELARGDMSDDKR